eukprot:scaffold78427_cov19-Tisochrysis_lutea.AAC.1
MLLLSRHAAFCHAILLMSCHKELLLPSAASIGFQMSCHLFRAAWQLMLILQTLFAGALPHTCLNYVRKCLQVFTDNAHALDRVDAAAAAAQSPEALSEGTKRLKQRMLKRIV